MKKLTQLAIAALTCATLVGCALTPAQKELAVAAVGKALSVAQYVADVATQVVILRATGPEDAVKKGDFLDGVASGLRTLQGHTNGLVTPELVGTTVRQYTNPDKSHWNQYAEALTELFVTSELDPDSTLEAMAVGNNAAAKAARE